MVNNADRNISEPPAEPTKFCRRCSLVLDYMEKEDLYYCRKCGDGIPDELLLASKNRKEQQQQSKTDNAPVIEGSRDDSSNPSTTSQEQDIPIASKGTRSSQKKKDPFDYLRKDDAYLAKSGLNFVTDVIDFSDDRSTISSEELRKQNVRLRGKTIR